MTNVIAWNDDHNEQGYEIVPHDPEWLARRSPAKRAIAMTKTTRTTRVRPWSIDDRQTSGSLVGKIVGSQPKIFRVFMAPSQQEDS